MSKQDELKENEQEVRGRLESLTFEEKKAIVRYLFQDFKFDLVTITKKKLDEDKKFKKFAEIGATLSEPARSYWFGQGKDTGVWIDYSGMVYPTKFTKLLESLHNKHILKSLYAQDY